MNTVKPGINSHPISYHSNQPLSFKLLSELDYLQIASYANSCSSSDFALELLPLRDPPTLTPTATATQSKKAADIYVQIKT
jgi:hypothetical protein